MTASGLHTCVHKSTWTAFSFWTRQVWSLTVYKIIITFKIAYQKMMIREHNICNDDNQYWYNCIWPWPILKVKIKVMHIHCIWTYQHEALTWSRFTKCKENNIFRKEFVSLFSVRKIEWIIIYVAKELCKQTFYITVWFWKKVFSFIHNSKRQDCFLDTAHRQLSWKVYCRESRNKINWNTQQTGLVVTQLSRDM